MSYSERSSKTASVKILQLKIVYDTALSKRTFRSTDRVQLKRV